MIAAARLAAYEALRRVSSGEADLPAAIAGARDDLPDERDRTLTTEIATGVQRWRGLLDHLIGGATWCDLDQLDPEILDILRLSLYQLLYLTRVPAAAVVDDAVNLVRRARKKSATGFVNAVLRKLSRSRLQFSIPARPVDGSDRDAALDYLAIALSHPRWLTARWYDRMGFETAERWMQFDNERGPLTLRVNALAYTRVEVDRWLAAHGVTARPGQFAPDALLVEGGNPLTARAAEEPTPFLVQDEASQLVALLAGRSPGPRVLDTCAAPGGKTTALAAGMPRPSLVVACDRRAGRTRLLRRTLHMAGATHVKVVQADLLQPLPFQIPFDTVLVDAPCSGLGTLRRDPDIKWRRQEAELPAFSAAQIRMLDHAAAAVAPEGRLVYATCSSEPEENEQVARAFLRTHPEFAPLDARAAHPDLPLAVVDAEGHLRTTPHQHGLEAFFGAVFEKRQAL